MRVRATVIFGPWVQVYTYARQAALFTVVAETALQKIQKPVGGIL